MICIIATGRSGTNALRSVLRQESWIACMDEVLNPDLQRVIPGNLTDFMDQMLRIMPDWKINDTTAEVLIGDYFTYLQNLAVDCVPLIDIKGEQLRILDWPGVLQTNKPHILRRIMDGGYPILRVTRRNWLAQHASVELAMKTDEWVRNNRAVIKNGSPKLHINPRLLLGKLDNYASDEKQGRRWLSGYPRTAWLYYETLFDGSRLSSSARTEIERVVGRSLDPTLSIGTQKIAPPLEQLIDNYAEIQALLKGTPYEEFLDDK